MNRLGVLPDFGGLRDQEGRTLEIFRIADDEEAIVRAKYKRKREIEQKIEEARGGSGRDIDSFLPKKGRR